MALIGGATLVASHEGTTHMSTIREPERTTNAYTPYTSLRRLLVRHAATFPGGARALLAACGWISEDEVVALDRWVTLRDGKVPCAFLAVLGIPDYELRRALDEDVRAWEMAAKLPGEVTNFVQRLMPTVYRHRTLPRLMSVAAAVETIALVVHREGLPCVLPVGQIKMIGIEADGVWVVDHRPRIRSEGMWVMFDGANPALACAPSA